MKTALLEQLQALEQALKALPQGPYEVRSPTPGEDDGKSYMLAPGQDTPMLSGDELVVDALKVVLNTMEPLARAYMATQMRLAVYAPSYLIQFIGRVAGQYNLPPKYGAIALWDAVSLGQDGWAKHWHQGQVPPMPDGVIEELRNAAIDCNGWWMPQGSDFVFRYLVGNPDDGAPWELAPPEEVPADA